MTRDRMDLTLFVSIFRVHAGIAVWRKTLVADWCCLGEKHTSYWQVQNWAILPQKIKINKEGVLILNHQAGKAVSAVKKYDKSDRMDIETWNVEIPYNYCNWHIFKLLFRSQVMIELCSCFSSIILFSR